MSTSDSPKQLELARRRREELLRTEQWIAAVEVAKRLVSPDASIRLSDPNRPQSSNSLLGVWGDHEFLFPAFQFHRDSGRLMPQLKELLAILPADRTGWRQTFWLFQPHRQLNGSRPADVFAENPESVIKTARSDFEVSDENW